MRVLLSFILALVVIGVAIQAVESISDNQAARARAEAQTERYRQEGRVEAIQAGYDGLSKLTITFAMATLPFFALIIIGLAGTVVLIVYIRRPAQPPQVVYMLPAPPEYYLPQGTISKRLYYDQFRQPQLPGGRHG